MKNFTIKYEWSKMNLRKLIFDKYLSLQKSALFLGLIGISLGTSAQDFPASDAFPKRTINVPHTSSSLSMDGNLDPLENWNLDQNGNLDQKIDRRILLTPPNVQPVCGYSTPGPASNNIVTWSAQWDEDYLYIACKVIDNYIADADLFEIFASVGVKDVPNCSVDYPRSKSYNNSTTFQLQRYHKDKGFSSPTFPTDVVDASEWKDYNGYYIIEVALSWAAMQFVLEPAPPIVPGYKIMFDISSSDADQGDADRTSVLRWNECCSDRDWTENTQDGDLILSGPESVNDMQNLISTISLVPNPTNGSDVMLNIVSTQTQEVNISIMNAMSQSFSNVTKSIVEGTNNINLHTSELSEGMYWISISNGKSNIAKKLIINK